MSDVPGFAAFKDREDSPLGKWSSAQSEAAYLRHVAGVQRFAPLWQMTADELISLVKSMTRDQRLELYKAIHNTGDSV